MTHYRFYDCYGQDEPPRDALLRDAATVMVAFWRLAMMKRLGGSSNRPVMDGEEFIKQIMPEFTGIAFYRLEHYRPQFKYLVENGWINERNLRTPQMGFGNDEGFLLTEAAYQFIMAAGENDLLTAFYNHFLDRAWES